MDLPEMDRFHMLEMEYSLGKIHIKEKGEGGGGWQVDLGACVTDQRGYLSAPRKKNRRERAAMGFET